MRTTYALPALAVMTTLAACSPGNPAATTGNPMSSASTGAASQQPQPPNSVPVGGSVTAPLTSPTGVVGSTTVGPNTPGAYNPDTTQNPTGDAVTQPSRRPRRPVRPRTTY